MSMITIQNRRQNEMRAQLRQLSLLLAALTVAGSLVGCGGTKPAAQNKEFFTSGSKEADQRASQRMAKQEQLTGSGEGSGEKGVKESKSAKRESETSAKGGGETPGATGGAQATGKTSLFERLGGEPGISNIVADFTQRALQDPRVNWQRKGIKQGGFSIHSGKPVTWQDSPENVGLLQTHLVQFLSLATGGPSHYEGKEMKSAHANMHIGNPEFDAAVGDLKASLDKLQVPNKEQKELLSIIESTRPQIVTER
jgi:hemoglobin